MSRKMTIMLVIGTSLLALLALLAYLVQGPESLGTPSSVKLSPRAGVVYQVPMEVMDKKVESTHVTALSVPTKAVTGLMPTEVVIDKIGVRSNLESLVLNGDGMLQAPSQYETAGWYAGGVIPGEVGPAVIAGHLDSKSGGAVFENLDKLELGDKVYVGLNDGSARTFEVVGGTLAPKDNFPTTAVYGPTDNPTLRLVTCGGEFDRRTGHYRDNTVIFLNMV